MKIVTVVNFLYRGEANIFQENLDSFLQWLKNFNLKGWWDKQMEKIWSPLVSTQSRQSNFKVPRPDPPKEIKIDCTGKQLQNVENISKEKVAIPEDIFSLNKSMMEQGLITNGNHA